ncbi:MAG: carbohydrate kinase [Acidimicrobiales bacterium]|nr:carbohydrate kinase [Acidimicrobiales bacterium]
MIVSAGEALVDMVPDPRPGGGPYNVAIAAARLGHPAAFAGRISTDEYGELLWSNLQDNRVDLRLVERGPEPTARAVVEGDPPTFRFEGDDTADTMLSAVDLAGLGTSGAIVHGGTLGMFRGRTAHVLADLAERHAGVVSLDPNVRPKIIDDRTVWEQFHERWLQHTAVYKASEEDLEWIWPGRHHSLIADELLHRGVGLVAVSHGPEGATMYSADHVASVPGQPVDVADTVGAGDTFVAALLVGLAELGMGQDPAALRTLDHATLDALGDRATATAAITCTRVGADPPHRSELPPELQTPLCP